MKPLARDLIGPSAALLQGDVFLFRDQQFGIVATQFEMLNYSCSNLTVVLVLPESSVRERLPGVGGEGLPSIVYERKLPCA